MFGKRELKMPFVLAVVLLCFLNYVICTYSLITETTCIPCMYTGRILLACHKRYCTLGITETKNKALTTKTLLAFLHNLTFPHVRKKVRFSINIQRLLLETCIYIILYLWYQKMNTGVIFYKQNVLHMKCMSMHYI